MEIINISQINLSNVIEFNKYTIFFLIFWIFLFTSINFYFNFEKKSNSIEKKYADDIRNRMVSIIHGISTLFLTFYMIIYKNPNFGQKLTNYQIHIIMFSLSYFIYDIIACFYYKLADIGLIIHHTLCITGYISVQYYGYGGTSCLCNIKFFLNQNSIVKN